MGWRSNEIMEMPLFGKKNALQRLYEHQALVLCFHHVTQVSGTDIHSKPYLPLLLSKSDLPVSTFLFFKLCISPDAHFYFPGWSHLFISCPSFYSLGCSVLCLFLTGVCDTTILTLICRSNYQSRFTTSFQAIRNNAKWNAPEAELHSILLELAARHFSFLVGFSATFEVILHGSENLLTQPKTVSFCFV